MGNYSRYLWMALFNNEVKMQFIFLEDVVVAGHTFEKGVSGYARYIDDATKMVDGRVVPDFDRYIINTGDYEFTIEKNKIQCL